MKRKIGILSVLIISYLVLILSSSCNSDMISSTKDIVFPDSNVSYRNHVEPFMRFTCGFGGCHNNYAAGGLNVNDYFNMTNYPGFIIPYNAEASVLIQILEQKLPHNPPLYLIDVNDNHRQGMRKWINEGALLVPVK